MARPIPTWVWFALGGGVLLVLGRKQVAAVGSKVVAAGKEAAFALAIGADARPYASIILRAASETGVDPFIIAAVGQRESNWGKSLRADGTGDCTARPKSVPPMPPDGKCWGRGIMQIDYGFHKPWMDTHNWADPYTNVRKGAEILADSFKFFASKPSTPYVKIEGDVAAKYGVAPRPDYPDVRPLSGNALASAAIAAYNAGNLGALRALAVGRHPDAATTGADYSTWVAAKVQAAIRAFV